MESLSWLAPLHVMVPGVLAGVRRLDMAHSLTFVAQCEYGTFRGDHLGECVLKSPMISVGIVALMSRNSKARRLDLSCIS